MKETIFTVDFRESGEEEEEEKKSNHKMGASFASAPITKQLFSFQLQISKRSLQK